MRNFARNVAWNDRLWLEHELRRIRGAFRAFRDTKGDDRCWADDDILYYEVLGIPLPTKLPPKGAFMGLCKYFIRARECPFPNISLEESRPQNDYDMYGMSKEQLRLEIVWMRKLARFHYKLGPKKRRWCHDKMLFDALPDRVAYDTRRPQGMYENCGRFYDAKEAEKSPRLHEW
jgi:hypothetical protein